MEEKAVTWPRPLQLVKSSKGSLRCVQACMVMAVKSALNRDITMKEAETMSGHVEGKETWPYQMMLALADLGLNVTSVERLDPKAFVADIEAELRRVLGNNEETIQYILGITDVEAETARVQAFIEHPRISYEVRAPSVDDLYDGVLRGELPLVTLDYGVLHQTGDYEGHMVVVSGVGPDYVEIYDPGPPGDAAKKVSPSLIQAAIDSPTEGVGAITFVRAQP
jgi:hypothetical protein